MFLVIIHTNLSVKGAIKCNSLLECSKIKFDYEGGELLSYFNWDNGKTSQLTKDQFEELNSLI